MLIVVCSVSDKMSQFLKFRRSSQSSTSSVYMQVRSTSIPGVDSKFEARAVFNNGFYQSPAACENVANNEFLEMKYHLNSRRDWGNKVVSAYFNMCAECSTAKFRTDTPRPPSVGGLKLNRERVRSASQTSIKEMTRQLGICY